MRASTSICVRFCFMIQPQHQPRHLNLEFNVKEQV
jgi:hypothetical protein